MCFYLPSAGLKWNQPVTWPRWIFHFYITPTAASSISATTSNSAMLDLNFYDLLASEARIASIIAIAKGEVPRSHWIYLNRPVTQLDGMRVLLSWSATMFEYLMPPLLLRSYPGTLLDESTRGAVRCQMDYAGEKGIPWGISRIRFLSV